MQISAKILSLIMSAVTFFYSLPQIFTLNVNLSELSESEVVISTDFFDFAYKNGEFSVAFNSFTMLEGAVSEYKLENKTVSSVDYEKCEFAVTDISDSRGEGKKLTAILKSQNLPDMYQNFAFYKNTRYFLLSTHLTATQGEVASNYISPMTVRGGKVQNGNPKWTNFLEVPFDNDGWVEFETVSLSQDGLAHEVGAFFTPDNKDGFIIGSVEHDTWKSAVSFTHKLSKIDTLTVYSGANTPLTRDQSPHGTVHGEKISSATFFVGFYDNWKDGMNEYAKINTTFTPKRESVIKTTPIGWNSWGSVQDKLNYETAVATSDYIKENLHDTWKDEENVVYINLDSYWDNLTVDELKAFVKHCEENGQAAGIYSAPFIVWWDEYGMQNNYVPGTDISYNDIRLKKADGTYYGNDIDGCYPLDVTHPATLTHFKAQLEKLMSCGFKYIKLDFLVHGALEGDYYDKSIQTGIEAYNYAMSKVCEIVGDDVFINLSMAPIFPYNYANGRRLACDSYYNIGATEYTMNALTYGFWQNEIYDYIDPDHIVIWGKDAKATENEARSRFVSGIVTGGSFLAGDNFVNPSGNSSEAFARYSEILSNKKAIDILKLGKPFEGAIPSGSTYAANVFTLTDGNKMYIAVLNYNKIMPKTVVVSVPENCTAENIFTGEKINASGESLAISLSARDGVIYEINL